MSAQDIYIYAYKLQIGYKNKREKNVIKLPSLITFILLFLKFGATEMHRYNRRRKMGEKQNRAEKCCSFIHTVVLCCIVSHHLLLCVWPIIKDPKMCSCVYVYVVRNVEVQHIPLPTKKIMRMNLANT